MALQYIAGTQRARSFSIVLRDALSRVGTISITLSALAGLASCLIPNAMQSGGFALCLYVSIGVYLVSTGVRVSRMRPHPRHTTVLNNYSGLF